MLKVNFQSKVEEDICIKLVLDIFIKLVKKVLLNHFK